MNRISEHTKDAATVRHPSRWPHLSVSRPPSSSTAAPKAGSAMTSTSGSAIEPAALGSTTGTWCPSAASTLMADEIKAVT